MLSGSVVSTGIAIGAVEDIRRRIPLVVVGGGLPGDSPISFGRFLDLEPQWERWAAHCLSMAWRVARREQCSNALQGYHKALACCP